MPRQNTGHPQLRELYREQRISLMADRVRTFKPKILLFMGTTAASYFSEIAGVDVSSGTWAELPHGGLTLLARHPGARGRDPRKAYAMRGREAFERLRERGIALPAPP